VEPDESPERAAERIVRESADVDCAVQDVSNATIVGICNSEDPSAETLYQLQIVFTAEVEEPPASTTETVRWDDEPNAAGLESVR
jgi:ADP-ribose pyrophosphatase YjhB (NUDIX family)